MRLQYKKMIAMFLLTLCLSGCSKAERDELSDDIRSLEENGSLSSVSDAEESSVGIPERINYTISGTVQDVRVNAEVISAGYGQVSVWQEEKVIIDDTYLVTLAETVFDAGKYEVVKPYFMCSRSELEDEAAYLEQWYEFYNQNSNTCPEWIYQCQEAVDYFTEYYDEENTVSDLTEGKVVYQTQLSDGNNGPWRQCILRGTVGGDPWQLLYMNQNIYSSNMSLELYRLNEEHPIYKLIGVEDEVQIQARGDNPCGSEECEREAREMAEKLGFDMETAKVFHRVYADKAGNEALDGYRIFMVRNTDGIQHIFGGDISVVISDNGGLWNANQQCIAFDINAEGVTGIFVNEIYRRGDCIAGEVKLLSFDKVDEMAQEYMQTEVDALSDFADLYPVQQPAQVNSVYLGYLTLHYGEGYTLVPVWAYFLDNGTMWFGVNALDGSIVTTMDTSYWWIPMPNASGLINI